MTARHWLVFLSCCCLMACSLGLGVNSYGVFLTPVSEALGVGRASIALHASLSGLSVGFLCPLIVRRLQKGHFHVILCCCILMNCTAYLLMAFADRVWMFNLLGVLRGTGSAGFYTATCTMVLGNWFRKNQGTVTGITVSFSGLAGAILSPLLTYIITRFGYQRAYLFCAAFVALLALPSLFLTSLHPEDRGLLPYGGDELTPTVDKPISTGRMVNKLVYRSPIFLLFLAIAFVSAVGVGIASHLPGYTQSIGATAALGAAMISAGMVGNIIFKTLFGVMSDYIPPTLVFVIMICLNGSGLLMILLAGTTTWMLMLGAFLFGAIYSVTTMGLATLVRNLYGNKQYGNAYSIGISMGSIANAVSITLMGFVFDFTGSFASALILGIVIGGVDLLLLATVCKLGNQNRTLEDI